jgi:hypothetical protein
MALAKTRIVSKYTPLLAARGYTPTQILILLMIADHEYAGKTKKGEAPLPLHRRQ